jgi:ribosomal protein S18 acetylase RimI-like enzyme
MKLAEPDSLVIRAAAASDGDALGRMGAALARLHHEYDAARFMLPDDIEVGYRWWLLRELENRKAVIVVAQLDDAVVGYSYGRVEGKDWNRLLDRHGELVDLWVDPAARCGGIGARLTEAVAAELVARGAPRIVLSTAAPNATAQRLFTRLGFRATMIEMTREVDEASRPAVKRRKR